MGRLAAQLTDRVMRKLRTCRDCNHGYRYTPTHTHSRYCPQCLPNHPRQCLTCKTPFHPAIDTDRYCPVHVVHSVLF